jgi:hypothetical protein
VEQQSSWRSSEQAYGLLGLSFAASILLRAPYYQHSLVFVDEGFFASVAAELLHGSVLYRDVWCNNQPLVIYFCKWVFQLLGPTSIALHLGSLLLALLESWLLYRIGKRFFSARVGGLSALAFAVASTNFYTPRIIGLTPEQLMVVFTTGAVYFFLRALENHQPGLFFGAGLLSCGAVFAKPAAVPEILMFVMFPWFVPRLRPAQKAGALAWFGSGCLLGTGVLVFGLMAGGTLHPWWEQSVLSRVHYVTQIEWAAFLRNLARQPFAFGLIYLWAWILIWQGRKGADANRIAYRLVLAWLAAAFLGVFMGRRFYANYYIQVFPPVSLLAAVGLDHMTRAARRIRFKVPLILSLAALLPPFLWFQARTFAHCYYFFDAGVHQQVKLWDMCVIDRKLKDITSEVQALTQPGERIFVFGPNPEFYFLSGRRMATSFSTFDISDPAEPPYGDDERRTVETLDRTPPTLIIDSFRNLKMVDQPGWGGLVARHYRLYREHSGVRLFLRNDAPDSPGRARQDR